MQSTIDDVGVVQSTAEKIKSDKTQRFPDAASPGDTVRQGDVFITLMKSTPMIPQVCQPVEKPSKQLAPGNTQGSRHCIKSLRGVKVYQLTNANPYDGPIISSAKTMEITHPEHGNWILPPGCYAISYQRTEDSEGLIRRVQD